MSYQHIFAISQQGMDVERLRLDIVAHNIANQHSIGGANGQPFRPSKVVTQAQSFDNDLTQSDRQQGGIKQIDVIEENLPPKKAYEPGHPNADKQGYVTYPGVSQVDEMTTMIKASRAYEANVRMLNIAHTMALQALSIGEEK